MEHSCFARDANGREIVALNESAVNNMYWLMLHRACNYVFAVAGMVLNGLLWWLISNKSKQLGNLRPILWFSAIIDGWLAFVNFIGSPFVNTGYGRFVTIENTGMGVSNPNINGFIHGLVGSATISAWGSVPIQFLYRYHLVRYGEKPRGGRLVFYVIVTAVGFGCALFSAMNMYIYTDPDYLRDAFVILSSVGLYPEQYDVHGGAMTDLKLQIYNLNFATATFVSYAVVIYCSLRTRSFLKQVVISDAARRLNNDMNRVLFCLAMTPIVASVIPTIYLSVTVNLCKSSPVPVNVFISLMVCIAPLANPLMTIYFIRPYRKAVMNMVGVEMGSRIGYATHNSNSKNEHVNSTEIVLA